ncbi:hypothetical protein NM688_g7848 [Phlebia brevispora]|uniref:Uncharacterized protein n=1 Tax=Phlebia brevispora TaxID=194682 RepID=A0ACC1S0M1_9APHY|nr:hypothetical protein NM688_g7848 [Phlebia brevispora]
MYRLSNGPVNNEDPGVSTVRRLDSMTKQVDADAAATISSAVDTGYEGIERAQFAQTTGNVRGMAAVNDIAAGGQDHKTSSADPRGLDPSAQALVDAIIEGFRAVRAEGTNVWVEMSDAINDIDSEKLEHCRDDIDSLLVFTGLFSAILTSFVTESYAVLSPDPTSTTVVLLYQIALQTSSYTVTPTTSGSTINSTHPYDPLSPPFQPSLTDIRINRLWFISLILNLIVASFGILIKQWLREYKAIDTQYSSLRSRLRIRQFRYPALWRWKVLELVAFLPLLIQAALGLFLLGLCFFTWEVESGIGKATNFLVSAWFFFFLAAAFAPALSSDCPYKFSSSNRFWLYIGPKGQQQQKQQEPTASAPPTQVSVSCRNIPLEEAEVAKDERKELEALTTVDDILIDDGLLVACIPTIVPRSKFSPEEIMQFIRELLKHRLPKVRDIFPEPKTPLVVTDLSALSSRAWEVIRAVIAETLQDHGKPGQSEPWMNEALGILASKVSEQASTTPQSPVASILARYGFRLELIGSGGCAGVPFRDLWAHFKEVLPPECFIDPLQAICAIHQSQYCQPHCEHSTSVQRMKDHCPKTRDQIAEMIHTAEEPMVNDTELPRANRSAFAAQLSPVLRSWHDTVKKRSSDYGRNTEEVLSLLAHAAEVLH